MIIILKSTLEPLYILYFYIMFYRIKTLCIFHSYITENTEAILSSYLEKGMPHSNISPGDSLKKLIIKPKNKIIIIIIITIIIMN